ncbi:hypothetical protein PHYPO_G00221430 [Pangasianodon hypophthalmus]|uniref:Uncharacterized protein n=1 Tax=Pangasianodon hypophthalmus TaxID=310915 RepID=A0A5N5NVT0_PANHP|nr:hypothetical protein PHYPO_G00221430 [Pangasianodon hypophthalmus]
METDELNNITGSILGSGGSPKLSCVKLDVNPPLCCYGARGGGHVAHVRVNGKVKRRPGSFMVRYSSRAS